MLMPHYNSEIKEHAEKLNQHAHARTNNIPVLQSTSNLLMIQNCIRNDMFHACVGCVRM